MTFYLRNTLADGTTVVQDNLDRCEFVLAPGVWERIRALPHQQQRAAVERAVLAARADPTGGRSELDEDTMRLAEQGHADQQQEGAR